MSRFQAIGNYVYEKGNRIGVTPDEASVELAKKLNAYQMRVERLKAEVEELRGNPDLLTVYLYAAELCKDDIKTLKDEVKRLTLLQVETLDERNKAEAEVERLRYVGDGMAVMVGHIEVTGDAHRMMLELSKEWNAAKEGKPEEIEVGDIIYVNGTKCRVLWCDPTEYGMRLTASEDAYSKRAAKEGKPSV